MSGPFQRALEQPILAAFPMDAKGFTGRECPNPECLGYFKVKFGTGLTVPAPCTCPYCGTKEGHDHFMTPDQLDYARSVAMRHVTAALRQGLKQHEFEIKPPRNALFGIGISVKLKDGALPTLHRYAEKPLETEVRCDRCTLAYAIYGVFGFCPDCGTHNNLAILQANLRLLEKVLDLAEAQAESDPLVAQKLLESAAEGCVSAFDGWGRATVAALISKAREPNAVKNMSFQRFETAMAKLHDGFGFDVGRALGAPEQTAIGRLFQKRHLLAHKLGVVDEAYLAATADPAAAVGRRIGITSEEIRGVLPMLARLAAAFSDHVNSLP
jgi:hypothetical protein